LGELEVDLDSEGRVRAPGSPYFAGSALTMDVAVANTARFCELPIDAVLPLATTQPARYLDISPAGMVSAEWDAATHRLAVQGVRV
jgi:N-acetylglucosamine-6-phosphate deacetylase